MSLSSVRASRMKRLFRVNPAALATRWRAWQAPVLIEFKKQTLEELARYMSQNFEERFNESDAENYHDFTEEILMYLRRVKGNHQHVRSVDYGDVALVRRRASQMATCILWRRHRHLERVIRRYEIAMRARDQDLIVQMCGEVERVAQSFNYKNDQRLLALHTAAEMAAS